MFDKVLEVAIQHTWNWATVLPIVLPAFTSIVSIGVAWLVLRHSRKAQGNQLYLGFLNEYKSKEMLAAMQGLYRFRDECKKLKIDCLKNEYKIRESRLLKTLESTRPEKVLCVLENSLIHQRRIVSHFYHAIYTAAKRRIISRKRIFNFWPSGGDEGIIAILNEIGVDGGKELDELYRMAKKHERRKKRRKSRLLRRRYWLQKLLRKRT